MTVLPIKNANGDIVYLEVNGSGTDTDPYVPVQQIGNQISGFATETKSEAIRVLVEILKNWADTSGIGLKVNVSNPVDVSTLATQTTLSAIQTLLNGGVDVNVSNPIDVSGLATQTTLSAIQTLLTNGIDITESNPIDVSGLATQTTLTAIQTLLNGGVDVTVSNPVDVSALNENVNKSFAKNGIQFLGNTTPTSGNFYGLTTITETTIASMTVTNSTSLPTGVAIPAGITLMMPITAITLTSGSVLLYKV